MSLLTLFCCFFLFLCVAPSISYSAVVAPIEKDHTTSLYRLSADLKTPLQPTKLHLDLGFRFSWVDCTKHYNSSSYQYVYCDTPLCNGLIYLACSNCFEPPGPGCANNSCGLFPENGVTHQSIIAEALVDTLALPSTDGRNPGRLSLFPKFVFSCSKTSLLNGLAKGVTGLAALGRFNYSLAAQVSSPFVFALCLPGSPSAPGVALFGTRGPYYFLPGIDLSKSLIYTPLILNPVGGTIITYYGYPSAEYFIGLTGIKVNGKAVPINQTLLVINQEDGFGGTKLSTDTPYTLLERSTYGAFTEAFARESAALNLTLTTPVKPFKLCYKADGIPSTRLGPAVPTVDLVMHSEDVFWRIFGANSMVRIVSKKKGVDAWCLAFLDGGINPRTTIVIGGQQMEDNLLQFDVDSKRFGFSSSLLFRSTTCSNFNFTTNNNIH